MTARCRGMILQSALTLLLTISASRQETPQPSCFTDHHFSDSGATLQCSNIIHFNFITEYLSSLKQRPLLTFKLTDSPRVFLQKQYFNHSIFNETTEVRLLGCDLASIRPEWFQDFHSMSSFWADSNKLTSINSSSFTGLEQIEFLSLDSNRITSIAEDTFRNMTKLQNIYMNRNELHSIPDNLFLGLDAMKGLYLNDNMIMDINDVTFKGLVSLKWLEMESNNISRITSGALLAMSGLEILKLGNNQLVAFHPELFRANVHLTLLGLSGNNLEHLYNFPLHIPSLTSLEMANCRIQTIPDDYFASLVNLISLNLSGNMMKVLRAEYFNRLTKLSILNLCSNMFHSLKVGTFTELYNRFHLAMDLSNNPWNCTHADMMDVRSNCSDNGLSFVNIFQCTEHV